MSLHSTLGVVLHSVKYSETSLIAQIYTEKFGMQGFLIQGAYRNKSKLPANIFQPLSLLDIDMYYKNNASLKKMKQVVLLHGSSRLYDTPIKLSVAFFLAEIIYNVLREQEQQDESIFDFIHRALKLFYHFDCDVIPFTHVFLINFISLLGFEPDDLYQKEYFDMKLGKFTPGIPPHHHFIEYPMTESWYNLIRTKIKDYTQFNNKTGGNKLLTDKIIEYYALHIESFPPIHSLEVLKTIWSDS